MIRQIFILEFSFGLAKTKYLISDFDLNLTELEFSKICYGFLLKDTKFWSYKNSAKLFGILWSSPEGLLIAGTALGV